MSEPRRVLAPPDRWARWVDDMNARNTRRRWHWWIWLSWMSLHRPKHAVEAQRGLSVPLGQTFAFFLLWRCRVSNIETLPPLLLNYCLCRPDIIFIICPLRLWLPRMSCPLLSHVPRRCGSDVPGRGAIWHVSAKGVGTCGEHGSKL